MSKLEYCFKCGEATGKAGAGDDSLYSDSDGPFCEDCYSLATPSAANGAAAIASQAPRQALSDADIQRIGRNLQAIKSMQFRAMQGRPMTVSESEEYEVTIAFARAIEAASGPNAALVEALQEMCDLVRLEVADGEHTTEFLRARAALAAVGVEP